mgnify:CR=1 FL=1
MFSDFQNKMLINSTGIVKMAVLFSDSRYWLWNHKHFFNKIITAKSIINVCLLSNLNYFTKILIQIKVFNKYVKECISYISLVLPGFGRSRSRSRSRSRRHRSGSRSRKHSRSRSRHKRSRSRRRSKSSHRSKSHRSRSGSRSKKSKSK